MVGWLSVGVLMSRNNTNTHTHTHYPHTHRTTTSLSTRIYLIHMIRTLQQRIIIQRERKQHSYTYLSLPSHVLTTQSAAALYTSFFRIHTYIHTYIYIYTHAYIYIYMPHTHTTTTTTTTTNLCIRYTSIHQNTPSIHACISHISN